MWEVVSGTWDMMGTEDAAMFAVVGLALLGYLWLVIGDPLWIKLRRRIRIGVERRARWVEYRREHTRGFAGSARDLYRSFQESNASFMSGGLEGAEEEVLRRLNEVREVGRQRPPPAPQLPPMATGGRAGVTGTVSTAHAGSGCRSAIQQQRRVPTGSDSVYMIPPNRPDKDVTIFGYPVRRAVRRNGDRVYRVYNKDRSTKIIDIPTKDIYSSDDLIEAIRLILPGNVQGMSKEHKERIKQLEEERVERLKLARTKVPSLKRWKHNRRKPNAELQK